MIKLKEVNFNEIIGNLNNERNYCKNDSNYYNLFIPYSSFEKRSIKRCYIIYSWRCLIYWR